MQIPYNWLSGAQGPTEVEKQGFEAGVTLGTILDEGQFYTSAKS